MFMIINNQNKVMILNDGRKLGFAEYNISGSQSVFYFHGSGSSRLEHPLDENILNQLNIRFISIDRPGNGLSDFQADRRLINWAKDILQLADHLGMERFHVIGHSAGGPHALSCAHQLSERIIAGAVISSVAPMNRANAYQGMPPMNQLLARSARHFPILVKTIRWIMRRMIMRDFEKSRRLLMSSIPETDKSILQNQQCSESFVNAVREGLRPGSRGVAQDDILINREWGFDLSEIKPRIDIWHGEADVNVPVGAAKYLREKLPNARIILLPGEGHFFIMKYWRKILSELIFEHSN
jgi:pimeloyl-ACP methyl ester carboxylesterase